MFFFFFQAEDGIRDHCVTGVQTCALPISGRAERPRALGEDAGDHEREDGRLGQPDTREVAAHTRSTLFSPRMPLGLNTRNTMTTANATTSRNSEPRGMRAAAVVWRTPKSRPPMIAP